MDQVKDDILAEMTQRGIFIARVEFCTYVEDKYGTRLDGMECEITITLCHDSGQVCVCRSGDRLYELFEELVSEKLSDEYANMHGTIDVYRATGTMWAHGFREIVEVRVRKEPKVWNFAVKDET